VFTSSQLTNQQLRQLRPGPGLLLVTVGPGG